MNPLFIAIVFIPAIEIYLLIKIGSQIGAITTILLIFATAVLGIYYAKYEGLKLDILVTGSLAKTYFTQGT